MTRYVFDLDGTICEEKDKKLPYEHYKFVKPISEMIDRINNLHQQGDYIIISTARHMNSTSGNIGLINARVAKITIDWLDNNGVLYDEIFFEKPYGDFYVDDKAMSIGSFLEKTKEKM